MATFDKLAARVSGAVVEGTMIRAGSMEGFANLLLEMHVNPAAVMRDAGLDPAILDKPDHLIPTVTYRKALNLASAYTGFAHFGLLLSQRQTMEKLGAVGYLVRHAPDLETSIRHLIAHFRIHDTGSMTDLAIDDDVAVWSHRLAGVGDEPAIQQTELALGLACRFIRSALGDSWAPDAILFEHSAPADTRAHAQVFRCPVQFDQTITCLEFPAADLGRPLRLSDAGLFAILERHVTSIEQHLEDDFASQVRSLIQESIETGLLRLAEAADRLGIPLNTLQRRLKKQQTSFQQLQDDVRFELARRHLRESSMPIAEISAILGYAEPAVFTRAFSRRAGTTPRSWRLKAGRPNRT